jgi:hypothetical protein
VRQLERGAGAAFRLWRNPDFAICQEEKREAVSKAVKIARDSLS